MIFVADVGTTATKAGIIDDRGKVLASASLSNPVLSPEPGAAEHDPHALWRTLGTLSQRLARGRKDRIDAVVLTGYQLSVLPLDDRCRPLGGIQTLSDLRSAETYDALVRRINGPALYRATGCPPFARYPLAKLDWMRRKRPALFRRARWFVGAKDWLMWRLTGTLATEPSISSATWMLNVRTADWDPAALRAAGVGVEKMPPVRSPYTSQGGLLPSAAKSQGLREGIPVVPGVYDAAALLIGLGGLEPGVAAVNFGTTAMLRIITRKPVLDRAMRLQAYALDGERWLGGSGVNNAGNGRAWLVAKLGLGSTRDLDRQAATIEPGSNGVNVFPYFTGERDPRIGNAPAAITGLREHHGPGHLARAHLEGVAFTIRMIMDAVRENGVRVREIRLGGAGAASPLWVRIIADVLGVPVVVPAVEHPSLLGCAAIGFAALGRFPSVDAAARHLTARGRRIAPDRRAASVYARLAPRRLELLTRLYGGASC